MNTRFPNSTITVQVEDSMESLLPVNIILDSDTGAYAELKGCFEKLSKNIARSPVIMITASNRRDMVLLERTLQESINLVSQGATSLTETDSRVVRRILELRVKDGLAASWIMPLNVAKLTLVDRFLKIILHSLS